MVSFLDQCFAEEEEFGMSGIPALVGKSYIEVQEESPESKAHKDSVEKKFSEIRQSIRMFEQKHRVEI